MWLTVTLQKIYHMSDYKYVYVCYDFLLKYPQKTW